MAEKIFDADKTALLLLLKSEDTNTRQSALEILMKHAPIPAAAIPTLRGIAKNNVAAIMRGLATNADFSTTQTQSQE